VVAGQLGLIGGAQPFFVFFPNPRKTSIQLLLEAQQHKKYAQTTPLDDGVSSLFLLKLSRHQKKFCAMPFKQGKTSTVSSIGKK
jgi:hypothetical protein